MAVDFSKIDDKFVGYHMARVEICAVPRNAAIYEIRLENVTFGQFISQHIHQAKHPRQVYQNLERAFEKAVEQQNSEASRRRRECFPEAVVSITLKLRAIKNAMGMIERNYFQ